VRVDWPSLTETKLYALNAVKRVTRQLAAPKPESAEEKAKITGAIIVVNWAFKGRLF
jgi:hypothetical protein